MFLGVLNFLRGLLFLSIKKRSVLKFSSELRLSCSKVFLISEKSEARVLKKVVLKKKKCNMHALCTISYINQNSPMCDSLHTTHLSSTLGQARNNAASPPLHSVTLNIFVLNEPCLCVGVYVCVCVCGSVRASYFYIY